MIVYRDLKGFLRWTWLWAWIEFMVCFQGSIDFITIYVCWVFGLGFDLNVDLFFLDSLGFCVMRFEFDGLLWRSLLFGWSWLFLGVEDVFWQVRTEIINYGK